MTTAILNYSKVHKRVQSKVDSLGFFEVNWKLISMTGFLMAFALMVFYVYQINCLTRDYYTINTYERQISGLAEENKNLQVFFAENSFLGQIQEKAQALNFQKSTAAKYVKILDNSVAIKK